MARIIGAVAAPTAGRYNIASFPRLSGKRKVPKSPFIYRHDDRQDSPMTLKDRITEDMKTAMRAKDSARLGTIRLLQAAMKQKEVDERVTLDDAAIVGILDKLIKQRKDSIDAFAKAARQDLVDKETAEMVVLQAYLPARLSTDEVAAEVRALVAELGASGPGDMGKVMGAAKQRLAGKADMGQVSAAVKAALAG
jgi:hypothetical protein